MVVHIASSFKRAGVTIFPIISFAFSRASFGTASPLKGNITRRTIRMMTFRISDSGVMAIAFWLRVLDWLRGRTCLFLQNITRA
jgi:hypothetical protein